MTVEKREEKEESTVKVVVVNPEQDVVKRSKVAPPADWRDPWVYYRGIYIRKSQKNWHP